ncbi:hypothetical protein NE237_020247 [Protea cynaroides]|uniref:Uncharacterized protein n=1 Tax=Protea cynaroides TaxID=273540 RepID=A0A9Q0H5M9_9MAGN|nr:hypothetical protein NE237_020247 [Protea cynaroides]
MLSYGVDLFRSSLFFTIFAISMLLTVDTRYLRPSDHRINYQNNSTDVKFKKHVLAEVLPIIACGRDDKLVKGGPRLEGNRRLDLKRFFGVSNKKTKATRYVSFRDEARVSGSSGDLDGGGINHSDLLRWSLECMDTEGYDWVDHDVAEVLPWINVGLTKGCSMETMHAILTHEGVAVEFEPVRVSSVIVVYTFKCQIEPMNLASW